MPEHKDCHCVQSADGWVIDVGQCMQQKWRPEIFMESNQMYFSFWKIKIQLSGSEHSCLGEVPNDLT